ncbi:MAG TPA: hypothetical protein VGK99_15285 [Acidobacteriota bacterium]|jgi:hypothetical protein
MSDTGRIPHVDDVAPVSDADDAIFAELRDVLTRHRALNRFGVTLLHEHFDVADDEILVETCDPDTRTLVTRPIKKAGLADEQLLETNWSLRVTDEIGASSGLGTGRKPIKTCRAVCQPVRGKGHSRVHYPV